MEGDIMEGENEKVQPVRIEGVWQYRYCPYEKRVYLVYRILMSYQWMNLDVGVYTFCYTCNIFLVTFDFTICWFQFWFVQPCEKIKGMFDFSNCLCYTCNICDNLYGLCRDYDLLLMLMEYINFLN